MRFFSFAPRNQQNLLQVNLCLSCRCRIVWIERSECDAKGCESGDKPQKFSQRRGMCPSCHGVAEIKKVTARYGVTRACMIPALWRAMRTRRTAWTVTACIILQSAKKCTACQGVHWKLDESWEKKRTVWDLLPMTNSK